MARSALLHITLMVASLQVALKLHPTQVCFLAPLRSTVGNANTWVNERPCAVDKPAALCEGGRVPFGGPPIERDASEVPSSIPTSDFYVCDMAGTGTATWTSVNVLYVQQMPPLASRWLASLSSQHRRPRLLQPSQHPRRSKQIRPCRRGYACQPSRLHASRSRCALFVQLLPCHCM